MKGFQVADGTVVGRSHTERHIPNQDALYVCENDCMIFAAVCDGCGSAKYSEIGARLGAAWLAQSLRKEWRAIYDGYSAETYLKFVQQNVVKDIDTVSGTIKENAVDVISNYFLFTAVIAMISETKTIIASIGDGFFAVNGVVQQIGPYENNAPPYIAYNLVKDVVNIDPNILNFKVHLDTETRYVDTLMIGTDGLEDLISAEERTCPGKEHDVVGPISQFWTDDKYFKNPVALDRRLNVINKNSCKLENRLHLKKEPGILRDDTSLIVIRRKDDSISKREETTAKSD
jgi:hypothetical protein